MIFKSLVSIKEKKYQKGNKINHLCILKLKIHLCQGAKLVSSRKKKKNSCLCFLAKEKEDV